MPMPRLVKKALSINKQDNIILTDPTGQERLRVRVAMAYVSCEGLYAYVYPEESFLRKWGAILTVFLVGACVFVPYGYVYGYVSGLLTWLLPPALMTTLLMVMRSRDNKKWANIRAEVEKKLLSLQERLKENPDAL